MTGTARLRKAGLTGLVLLGIGAAVWWGREVRPPPLAPEDRLARLLVPEAVALAPDLYLLGRTGPAAAYVVDTREGLVLVDSGLEDDAAEVCEQMAGLGLDVGRLRAILLTHVHADHSLGAARLRASTRARVYAGRDDCRPLREGGPRVAFVSNYSMPDTKIHPTPVDVELAGDETIAFGEARFTAVAAPGHTPGSTCYLLERPDLRALFTGDVIMHLGPGGRSPQGTYTAFLPPVYRGNARDYLVSLRRLRALPLPDLILPGHPRMDLVPESPRLTSQRWHDLLDQEIAELEQVLARYDADGANFLDGVPKKLLPGLYYLGDCAGSAVYALDTPKGMVLFDAPGGPPLVDFLARRFQALGCPGRQPAAVLLTSADERATAGLAALAQASGCRVVAPRAGIEEVRRRCPAGTRLLTTEDLETNGGFEVQALPLQGRGLAPVAYRLSRAGKTVLVSGRIPVKPALPELEELDRDLRGAADRREQYLASLARLGALYPDLWLPAVPVEGQNANLYGWEWAEILGKNGKVLAVFP